MLPPVPPNEESAPALLNRGERLLASLRLRRPFWPVDGKGWALFIIQAGPVLVAGIKTCQSPRDWWALPFTVLIAGVANTISYHSDPPSAVSQPSAVSSPAQDGSKTLSPTPQPKT